MNVNLFGENMFLQAEKAAFEEAEKKKEEEVNSLSENISSFYSKIFVVSIWQQDSWGECL